MGRELGIEALEAYTETTSVYFETETESETDGEPGGRAEE
jgi:hypothetical protein